MQSLSLNVVLKLISDKNRVMTIGSNFDLIFQWTALKKYSKRIYRTTSISGLDVDWFSGISETLKKVWGLKSSLYNRTRAL